VKTRKEFVVTALCVLFVACHCYACQAYDKKDISKYIGVSDFVVIDDEYTIDAEMKMAVRYVDQKRKIFDCALGFSVLNGKVVPKIVFKNKEILDSKGNHIVDMRKSRISFYGWTYEALIATKKPGKVLSGFCICCYTNGGKNISDGLTIRWRKEQRSFKALEYPK
jgi:hypothetical protein